MPPKNIKIDLEINSAAIFPNFESMSNQPPFSSTGVLWISFVTLSDNNNGNNQGGTNATYFQSTVNPSSNVEWSPSQTSGNSDYKVAIVDIYNSPIGNSPIIFGETTLNGKSGKVNATVLSTASTTEPGANESYSIYFSITQKSTNTIKYYGFDPKIKVDNAGTN